MVLNRTSRIYVSRKLVNGAYMRRIPQALVPSLTKLTPEPFAWWTGQFIDQFINFSDDLNRDAELKAHEIDFSKPIVGIHIRATDIVSLNNLKKVGVSDYMSEVKDFYDKLELTEKVESRRVFVATDKPSMIKDIREQYPGYEIYVHDRAAQIASTKKHRFSKVGLRGIIEDLKTLVKCNFIVCTFSSNICRLMLEISQAKFPDTFAKVVSIDSIYFATLNNYRIGVVTQNHTAIYNYEIGLKVGEKVSVHSFQDKNGYYHGVRLSPRARGNFPAYKIQFNAVENSEIQY